MKRPPRQVRLEEDLESEIKKIAEVTDLSQIEIIRQTIKAGVLAIKANGYKLPLPLRLQVAETAESTYPVSAEQISRVEEAPTLRVNKVKIRP